jgi:hypothetical protein
MGEYDCYKPQDDMGHSEIEEDLEGYTPGMGAMVAMGYEIGASPQQYNPYPGYGPSMAQTDYPHGPHDEPDMGWEGFGGWLGRGRARIHGAWKDRRGLWARIVNRPMAPVTPVTALAPPAGSPAPPAPEIAPPAADMGFEWHDEASFGYIAPPPPPPPPPGYGGGYGGGYIPPPPPPGQWQGNQQWGQNLAGQQQHSGWGQQPWHHRWF